MKIEIVAIDTITPYKQNPRKNDAAVNLICKSITMFGFNKPIVIDKHNVVVVGHTRLKAALKLGMTEVPVYKAAHLTTNQAKAYRIADNRSHELSRWNDPDVKFELDEIVEINDTGLSLKEIDDILYPETKIMGKKKAKIKHLVEVIVECTSMEDMEELETKVKDRGLLCRKTWF